MFDVTAAPRKQGIALVVDIAEEVHEIIALGGYDREPPETAEEFRIAPPELTDAVGLHDPGRHGRMEERVADLEGRAEIDGVMQQRAEAGREVGHNLRACLHEVRDGVRQDRIGGGGERTDVVGRARGQGQCLAFVQFGKASTARVLEGCGVCLGQVHVTIAFFLDLSLARIW